MGSHGKYYFLDIQNKCSLFFTIAKKKRMPATGMKHNRIGNKNSYADERKNISLNTNYNKEWIIDYLYTGIAPKTISNTKLFPSRWKIKKLLYLVLITKLLYWMMHSYSGVPMIRSSDHTATQRIKDHEISKAVEHYIQWRNNMWYFRY